MIWLIGNKGMLGSEVEKLLKERGLTYWASDKEIVNELLLDEKHTDLVIQVLDQKWGL